MPLFIRPRVLRHMQLNSSSGSVVRPLTLITTGSFFLSVLYTCGLGAKTRICACIENIVFLGMRRVFLARRNHVSK
ncbi:hypothetical protein METBIDRAFT_118829 [Metschnikowia bicuspidata var. bicuspidata NRRL YB-4993]|uniref:Uncharacterized protein n=1 Tax=Metschnikowia bicuspidata var. bicuspidata NRRL YB-4993 TaxID=869754 RepID=A0A1A0HK30_9ASCO|nr:hypothetical protein METBIDRAFT_118829 [Metschnikowia bicuspidata var. bicuspidata NRRL YB-4993]OBA24163.1 hypothetical protein METBIDRAFT_118829 [Metschnikowia bicuspidata var. bicuspidata NRRL YB-4993]